MAMSPAMVVGAGEAMLAALLVPKAGLVASPDAAPGSPRCSVGLGCCLLVATGGSIVLVGESSVGMRGGSVFSIKGTSYTLRLFASIAEPHMVIVQPRKVPDSPGFTKSETRMVHLPIGFSSLGSKISCCNETQEGENPPVFNSHERPTRVPGPICVLVAPSTQNALDPVRADHLNLDVTAACMRDPDLDSDMLQFLKIVTGEHLFGDFERTGHAIGHDGRSASGGTEEVHSATVDLNNGKVHPNLWFHQTPFLGRRDEMVPVNSTITVLVAERSADCSLLPVGVIRVDLDGSLDAKVLNVTPGEVRSEETQARSESEDEAIVGPDRPCAERQSDDTGSIGSGSRSTTVGGGTLVLPDVRGYLMGRRVSSARYPEHGEV